MKPSWLYRIVKVITRLGLKIYFSEIEIVGLNNLPKKGPFILAANHQNAFLDALVIGGLFERNTYFITRADVFNAFSAKFFSWLNMLPIYRIRDGYKNLNKNEAIFQECRKIFRAGEGILIFPEASHSEYHFIRNTTKGTARLAYQAQSDNEQNLQVIPCGLNYFSHRRPRRKLSIAIGEPIAVGEFNSLDNEAKNIQALKQEIEIGMKSCLIIPDGTADYPQKKAMIFNDKNEFLSFHKLRKLAEKDYSNMTLARPRKPAKSSINFYAFFNALPLLILQLILKQFEDKVFWASMKFVVMLVMMPLWWILLIVIFGWSAGIALTILSIVTLYARAEIVKNH